MNEFELYASGMSLPEVSNETGISMSTLRYRIKKAGLLRSRADAVRLAGTKGKLGSGNRGKKINMTKEWRDNISKSKTGVGKGESKKPNGYIEITMGENKGRMQHVVLMEKKIGRRLYSNECVHHKDHDKSNNEMSNLQLMTRAEHSRLHALENGIKRNRDNLWRYK